jgi:hypothetical protein
MTATLHKDDLWKPRTLSGGVYCSPACGGRCRRHAYDRAVKEADKLVARLGDGWEPMVWENLGWHWAANKGVAEVYPSTEGSDTTGDYEITGWMVFLRTAVQIVSRAETPEDALGFAVQDARGAERRIVQDLAELVVGQFERSV